jgi:hypothetical protein
LLAEDVRVFLLCLRSDAGIRLTSSNELHRVHPLANYFKLPPSQVVLTIHCVQLSCEIRNALAHGEGRGRALCSYSGIRISESMTPVIVPLFKVSVTRLALFAAYLVP